MSPTHRPRKKRKTPGAAGSNGDLVQDLGDGRLRPAFPLVSFLWAARAGVSQWLVLPVVLMVAGLFRWAVGLWGYSGFGLPPMYGDFEAQRHWMELTSHLPMAKWYIYDLQYWGLDYPPLTAYHSWLLGKIGALVEPAWFALDSSRGAEAPLLKVYMRATVVVSEYVIYVPAVVNFLRRYTRMQGVAGWRATIALAAVLLQPATMLVDHGHFQYNTVMLGLVTASLDAILAGRMLWACVFFVGALGFKQMALYYAPVMFSFLLGVCVFPRVRLLRLAAISLATLAAFAVLVAPLLVAAVSSEGRLILSSADVPPLLQPFVNANNNNNNSSSSISISRTSWMYPPLFELAQIIHRVFPFSRGLFEDKVANAWCAMHTFYKLHRFPATQLQRASLGATLAAIVVPCAVILSHPRASLLLPALAAVGWGFFLFSFQVHEKSVLLPLLPMTLLLAHDGGLAPPTRAWVGWANLLGAWTLFPLLKREGLQVPYFVLVLVWAYLLGVPPVSWEIYRQASDGAADKTDGSADKTDRVTKIVHVGFYGAMIGWHVLEATVAPPRTKPDLWVVLNVLVGAGGFGIAYCWCLWKLATQSRQRRV